MIGWLQEARGDRMNPKFLAGAGAAALALLLASSAMAVEKLRVGKAVAEAFSFVPLDVGMRKGVFARHGLEIEATAFTGDARMQQATASSGSWPRRTARSRRQTR
jgi:ABC-type nitrate/sulfonate/bicarbonate transport system substrate-binding protein